MYGATPLKMSRGLAGKGLLALAAAVLPALLVASILPVMLLLAPAGMIDVCPHMRRHASVTC